MKIAIYIRVSTKDQAKEGYSLEVQREYLESFAKREGSLQISLKSVVPCSSVRSFGDRTLNY